MKGLCSVTWESVKVRRQNKDERSLIFNSSFILLLCLFIPFLQSSSASGRSGLPVLPAFPHPPWRTALSKPGLSVALRWCPPRDVSGRVWTSILVSQSLKRRRMRASVRDRLSRSGFVQMWPSAEVMVFVREDKGRFSFISGQKCSQFLRLPSSGSSSVCSSTARESNEFGSLALCDFPPTCCYNMTLCSQQMISCSQRKRTSQS